MPGSGQGRESRGREHRESRPTRQERRRGRIERKERRRKRQEHKRWSCGQGRGDRHQERGLTKRTNVAVGDFWGTDSSGAKRSELQCRDMPTCALACHDSCMCGRSTGDGATPSSRETYGSCQDPRGYARGPLLLWRDATRFICQED